MVRPRRVMLAAMLYATRLADVDAITALLWVFVVVTLAVVVATLIARSIGRQ